MDLERFLKHPESQVESKVLIKVLIKEYIRVVGKLQQYEPDGELSEEDEDLSVAGTGGGALAVRGADAVDAADANHVAVDVEGEEGDGMDTAMDGAEEGGASRRTCFTVW